MNERIRELHSQCKVCDKDTVVYFDYERFAELIIKECLDQCYNKGMNDALYEGQLKAALYIEQHFGIAHE